MLAQDTVNYRIETTDGNTFIGPLISEDSVSVIIKTGNLGEIRIPKSNIRTFSDLETIKRVGESIWLPNPQSTRYYWAPNGYGLEKGSAYYQNIWIFYNQVSVGLTDNFSIGAGLVPLFLFAGGASPFWVVPKFSIPVVKDKFNLGTGAFLGTILGEDTGIFGLLYGTGTLGSRDRNISLGLAYGFANDSWMKKPIINLSGMLRVSAKSYLISENYFITLLEENIILSSFGGRSIIRNVGIDYSLWIPLSELDNAFFAIPFLGITVPIVSRDKR